MKKAWVAALVLLTGCYGGVLLGLPLPWEGAEHPGPKDEKGLRVHECILEMEKEKPEMSWSERYDECTKRVYGEKQ